MNKMPAGAIASAAELEALIERAKKGERINLYWVNGHVIRGTDDRYRLTPTTTYHLSSYHKGWIAFDNLALHVATTPDGSPSDFVFSNYWYALAWRHTSLKRAEGGYEDH